MSGDSMMELERPGEEKKKRWEAKTEAKSGGGGGSQESESEEEEKKSSVESWGGWLKRNVVAVVVVVVVEGEAEELDEECFGNLRLKKQRGKCLEKMVDIFAVQIRMEGERDGVWELYIA